MNPVVMSSQRTVGSSRRLWCWVAAVVVLVIAAALVAAGQTRAAAWSPAATQTRGFVPVDGAEIAYREINPATRGTPLVLIVGYGSTMAEWIPR